MVNSRGKDVVDAFAVLHSNEKKNKKLSPYLS